MPSVVSLEAFSADPLFFTGKRTVMGVSRYEVEGGEDATVKKIILAELCCLDIGSCCHAITFGHVGEENYPHPNVAEVLATQSHSGMDTTRSQHKQMRRHVVCSCV